MTVPRAVPPTEPVVWRPSYRITPARYVAVPYLEVAASAADADRNLELARLTDGLASGLLDAYRLLPNEDRLSGPGSGLLMPSFLFPARPGRFSTGLRGGTYYAARDEATARAETTYHFAVELEAAPAALAAALAAGRVPRRAMQVITADVYGPFLDVRGARDPLGVGDVYHSTDYRAGQRLELRVRTTPLDGMLLDGVLYDSVRRRAPRAECVAVYRPRALRNGTVAGRMTYVWQAPGRVAVGD